MKGRRGGEDEEKKPERGEKNVTKAAKNEKDEAEDPRNLIQKRIPRTKFRIGRLKAMKPKSVHGNNRISNGIQAEEAIRCILRLHPLLSSPLLP
jgi:hypothetical protein